MTNWCVWSAQSNEAAALIRLEAQSFGARSWGEKSLRESFSAPGVAVLLAGTGLETPVGFALWRDLAGEAELLTLGVASAHLRNGGGRALLDAVVEGARSARAERLFLEVDGQNTAALSLYAGVGFEHAGIRRAYYRDGSDALILQLML